MNIKYTTEMWIAAVKKKWNYNYDYSKVEYKSSKEKVCIICHEKDENGVEHGEFWQEANAHKYHEKRCPKCFQNAKYTNEQFIKKANKIHHNKYNYDKVIYNGCRTDVKIWCPIHGYFLQKPEYHLKGHGCPKCAPSGIPYTTEEWINKVKLIHNDRYDYSKTQYINSYTNVCIICPIHGEFFQTPHAHLAGCGCPKCTLKSQNKLFEKLKEVLQEELVWEYTTDWLEKQRIDIFIPKYNIGIEYHGIQHYEPVDAWGGEDGLKINQQRDTLKLEKCNNHGVKLLYLKYDYSEQDFENLVQDIHKIIENPT